MKAKWVLVVVCVIAACGGPTPGGGINIPLGDAAADTSDELDVPFDLVLDVADSKTVPDALDVTLDLETLDVPLLLDALDVPLPLDALDETLLLETLDETLQLDAKDTTDTTSPPDTLDTSDPDLPCVPDCEGRDCGDDGCGGSCGVCVNPCDPCGLKGGPWEDPSLCLEPEGVCTTLCCPLCCDDVECGDDQCGGSCGVCDPPELSSFAFLASDNPGLEGDIQLDIQDNVISGNVPYSGDIDALIATYSHVGASVLVGAIEQTSGVTENDFSHGVSYSVTALDGQQASYDVRVKYFTGLPIFYIDTNDVPINSKVNYTEGVASTFGGLDYEDSPFAYMQIRGRGHSTWSHPKKPYQLNFADKSDVLGMPEDKKWILLANYSDKTMMRTSIGFEMGYISNLDWTPESHYAEVFINDIYNGTYNIAQKVEATDNRVALGDTGYLIEMENINHIAAGDVYFYTDHFLLKIKEPELTEGSPEYLYAEEYFNEFEAALLGDDFTNPVTGYPSYIDIDSFVDWYLINEITKNVDAKSYSSIYLSVIPGEKIKMGPLWDFDLSFGNVNYAPPEFPEGFWVKDNIWYNRLFQDPDFVALIKSRFAYFMDNMDYILDTMDFYAAYLSMAQEENNNKWNTIGVYVWPNPVVYDTYEEEVIHLKEWYVERMNWLDTAINNL